jgi:DNA-binding CsgD family transcriptional regulator
LSPRQRDCLALKANGASDSEIGHKVGISASTVGSHLGGAKRCLSAKSREHAVALALKDRQIA